MRGGTREWVRCMRMKVGERTKKEEWSEGSEARR